MLLILEYQLVEHQNCSLQMGYWGLMLWTSGPLGGHRQWLPPPHALKSPAPPPRFAHRLRASRSPRYIASSPRPWQRRIRSPP